MKISLKELSILIVDLRNQENISPSNSSVENQLALSDEWKKASIVQKQVGFKFARSGEAACEIIIHQPVVAIAIYSHTFNSSVANIVQVFHKNSGYLQDFQMIINDQPDPWFMANALEYGIDRYCAEKDWVQEVKLWSEEVTGILLNKSRPELSIFQLTKALLSGDETAIETAMSNLNQYSLEDPQAAYARGLFQMSTNRVQQAINSLQKASSTSRFFRTASLAYAQILVTSGQSEQAIEILERLEKTNPKFAPIFLNLVAAYSSIGNLEKARIALAQLNQCEMETDNAIALATMRLHLAEDRIDEAIAIIPHITSMSQQDITFLIKCGLSFTKKNLQGVASKLYRQAHKTAPESEKYRVSLNAALSAYYFKEFDLALMYLSRGKTEKGSDENEVSSIENAIRSAMLKNTA